MENRGKMENKEGTSTSSKGKVKKSFNPFRRQSSSYVESSNTTRLARDAAQPSSHVESSNTARLARDTTQSSSHVESSDTVRLAGDAVQSSSDVESSEITRLGMVAAEQVLKYEASYLKEFREMQRAFESARNLREKQEDRIRRRADWGEQ